MKFFYQIGTAFYFLFIRLASLWNPKAKLFIQGRRKVKDTLDSFNIKNEELYWFHCASLGEFEQARPIIEQLKSSKPCQIVITFFSPSGYEIRKDYKFADLILYLPRDSRKNAELILNSIKPSKIFFIKYEFWANYLLEAKKRNIPTYLVSGVFRQNQVFFKWYGGFMREVLNSFTTIFLQNEQSKILLDGINIESTVTGDTRFDRVMQNAKSVSPFPLIEKFIGGQKTLVVGSCWAEDESVIFPILNQSNKEKIIIAPHEIDESHIVNIEKSLDKKILRYSNLESVKNVDEYDVLVH